MKTLLWLSPPPRLRGALVLTAAILGPCSLVGLSGTAKGRHLRRSNPVALERRVRIAHMGIANFYGRFEAIKGEITIADKAEDCKRCSWSSTELDR
jgi:hypothetical protein